MFLKLSQPRAHGEDLSQQRKPCMKISNDLTKKKKNHWAILCGTDSAWSACCFTFEMRSHEIAHTGLELHPPTSASYISAFLGSCHSTWLMSLAFQEVCFKGILLASVYETGRKY